MLETTIAGSLPKPAWLAKPRMLWAPWQLEGEALVEAKHDATLLVLKEQEDAGIDIVTDGEQARQHFVHGFLENIKGIDFTRRVTMGIRNNRYNAEVPTVTGPLRRKQSVHGFEAEIARAHTRRRLKFTLPGPMTIVDTIADAHYGDKVALAMAFAALLNEEARELAEIGVDVVQFDEPAFNVYMEEVTEWGIAALHRAAEDLPCKTAVHICYGYGINWTRRWRKADSNPRSHSYESFCRGAAEGRSRNDWLGSCIKLWSSREMAIGCAPSPRPVHGETEISNLVCSGREPELSLPLARDDTGVRNNLPPAARVQLRYQFPTRPAIVNEAAPEIAMPGSKRSISRR
jgi:methionine synthase II (cobalamin-independent)